MNQLPLSSDLGVTLLGGGPILRPQLAEALAIAPTLVAADGGADHALRAGLRPEAVIGDLDSLSRAARVAFADRLQRVTEQESTDFDKALRHISAPFLLGLGFSGGRMDHGLAVLNSLVRHPQKRALILSGTDVIFHAPPGQNLALALPPGSRLSLFPLAPVTGRSEGLRWPIEGLAFSPAGVIGTSNIVRGERVELAFDAPGMLVILPRAALRSALRALLPDLAL